MIFLKFSIIAVFLAEIVLGALLENRACGGNNCGRQVKQVSSAIVASDCSSFQSITVNCAPS